MDIFDADVCGIPDVLSAVSFALSYHFLEAFAFANRRVMKWIDPTKTKRRKRLTAGCIAAEKAQTLVLFPNLSSAPREASEKFRSPAKPAFQTHIHPQQHNGQTKTGS